jgi:hypothetical protein
MPLPRRTSGWCHRRGGGRFLWGDGASGAARSRCGDGKPQSAPKQLQRELSEIAPGVSARDEDKGGHDPHRDLAAPLWGHAAPVLRCGGGGGQRWPQTIRVCGWRRPRPHGLRLAAGPLGSSAGERCPSIARRPTRTRAASICAGCATRGHVHVHVIGCRVRRRESAQRGPGSGGRAEQGAAHAGARGRRHARASMATSSMTSPGRLGSGAEQRVRC